ncbi:hypothetical protein NP493_245g01021 [Ridgeia piscesae]|uniref:Cleavage and polyadenylation specificity factor subunit 4 n=1 Tax=Ridgeia piscesae TaxID=27915 RepID=A0AAD9NZ33_RIDPI|nr:hypothetical protein NP493_245g01021 [Ridgeia piscesae]
MEDAVANAEDIRFDIELALEQQLGAQPLPFPGMDKSGSAICTFYMRTSCSKGSACPFRHVRGDRSVVCKHWLRGLCKKGDDCEFLHEYDMTKMPECYFYSKFGQCSNKECPFLHIDPEKKMKDCPWYDRGFCRHGPNCKNRHVRRVMCQNYQCGFCILGPDCKYMHPKFDLPITDFSSNARKAAVTCHMCNEPGHKAINCPNQHVSQIKTTFGGGDTNTDKPFGDRRQTNYQQQQQQQQQQQPRRPLDQVTCFKCGMKGHYANKCPKGHLAFLSTTAAAGYEAHAQSKENHDMQAQRQADIPQFA